MWKKEILLFLMISLDFILLVPGDLGGSGERDLQLEKQINMDGIVKIAKTKNGKDVICYDKYKQPAFYNPLLKNHKLQLQPTTFPTNFEKKVSYQEAHDTNLASQNSGCPPDSIPIVKAPVKSSNSSHHDENNALLYRFALLQLIHYPDDAFHGASGIIKSDDPHCENGQNSGVSIWIASDNSEKKNVIKAGWMVYPEIFGDTESHFSVYWTSDGFHQTGCYNHLCSGFIQIYSGITLGDSYYQKSFHSASEFYVSWPFIFQDISTKHWWLIIRMPTYDIYFGYWPKELFTRFDQGATVLNLGGSTMAHEGQRFPPMGDGYFPNGLPPYSNFIGQIKYVNKSNYIVPPRSMGAKIHTDNPNCYDLIYQELEGQEYDRYLFLGGPGGNC